VYSQRLPRSALTISMMSLIEILNAPLLYDNLYCVQNYDLIDKAVGRTSGQLHLFAVLCLCELLLLQQSEPQSIVSPCVVFAMEVLVSRLQ
jgi:hypothetical protein